MKIRNSLWLVLGLLLVVLLQFLAIVALGGDVQDLQDQVSKKSLENWSQTTTSDADLAACQDALTIALEAVSGGGHNSYTVDAVAQDCLRR